MAIEPTPEKAPFPAPEYLKPSAQERSNALIRYDPGTDAPCSIPVNVGLFFDGTNNHMERDRDGKRVPVPWSKDELARARNEARKVGRNPDEVTGPPSMPDLPMTPESRSHSNVARLFEAYPWDKQELKKKPEERNKFETKIAEITLKTAEAKRKQEAGEPLGKDEEALLEEARCGTPYPLMKDADAGDMASGKEKLVFMQTDSRREGGGYIVRRGYYPHDGFFFRRSRNDFELEEALKERKLTPAQKRSADAKAEAEAEKAPREMAWSENLRRDIRAERMADAEETAAA